MAIEIPDQAKGVPSSTRYSQDRTQKDVSQQGLIGTNALATIASARPGLEALQNTIFLGAEVIQGVEDARIKRENIKDAKQLKLSSTDHIAEQGGKPHTYPTIKAANKTWREEQIKFYKKKYKNDPKGYQEFENNFLSEALVEHESSQLGIYLTKQAVGTIDTSIDTYNLLSQEISDSEDIGFNAYLAYKAKSDKLDKAHKDEKGVINAINPDHAVNEAQLKEDAFLKSLENVVGVETINGEKDYSVIAEKVGKGNYDWEKEFGWELTSKEKESYKTKINKENDDQKNRIKDFQTTANLKEWENITTEAQKIYNDKNLNDIQKNAKFELLKKKIKASKFYLTDGETMRTNLIKVVDNVAQGQFDTDYGLYQELIRGFNSGEYTSTTDKIKNGRYKGQRIINTVGSSLSFEDHNKIKQIANDPNLREELANDLKLTNDLTESILGKSLFLNFQDKEMEERRISIKGIVRREIARYLEKNKDLKLSVSDLVEKDRLKIDPKTGDTSLVPNEHYIDKDNRLTKLFVQELEDYVKSVTFGGVNTQTNDAAKRNADNARKEVIKVVTKPNQGGFSMEKHTVYVVDPTSGGLTGPTTISKDQFVNLFLSYKDPKTGKIKDISTWTQKEKEDVKLQLKSYIDKKAPSLAPAKRRMIYDDILDDERLKGLK